MPLKPPTWTEDRCGIELLVPPVCRRCRSSRSPSFVPSSGIGDGDLWWDSFEALSESDDDNGDEEMGRAQTVAEKGPRSLGTKGSGTLKRITEAGEEADHGMEEEKSVSGTVKRKRTGGAGPSPLRQKRREEYDSSDTLLPAGDHQYERQHAREKFFQDIGRYIGGHPKNIAVRKEPANTSAAAASTTTTYVSVFARWTRPKRKR